MSRHPTDQELIDCQFDLASPNQIEAVRAHLAACPNCAARRDRLVGRLGILNVLKTPAPASERLIADTLRRIRLAEPPRPARIPGWLWLTATAAATAIILAIISAPSTDVTERSVEVKLAAGRITSGPSGAATIDSTRPTDAMPSAEPAIADIADTELRIADKSARQQMAGEPAAIGATLPPRGRFDFTVAVLTPPGIAPLRSVARECDAVREPSTANAFRMKEAASVPMPGAKALAPAAGFADTRAARAKKDDADTPADSHWELAIPSDGDGLSWTSGPGQSVVLTRHIRVTATQTEWRFNIVNEGAQKTAVELRPVFDRPVTATDATRLELGPAATASLIFTAPHAVGDGDPQIQKTNGKEQP